jgi:hypothetical protein
LPDQLWKYSWATTPSTRWCAASVAVRPGQHGAGVEDVEALVLHGAHVEVVDRDDHEDVQVVFAAVDLFVPAHGLLQADHGVLALVDVFRLDIDAQRHAAGLAGEGVFDTPQVTGHQREQVRRFLERVFPGRPVAAVFAGPLPIGLPLDSSTG